MNPPIGTARTLATLLASGHQVEFDAAVRLVRNLAGQIADAHARGVWLRGITPATVLLDSDLLPSFTESDGRDESPAEARQFQPPELADLALSELPGGLVAAAHKLANSGISIDPRQVDIYALGALLCRLITGKSAMAYVRSVRAKRDLPVYLRPLVERALGSDGRERYTDAGQFAADLNRALDPALGMQSDVEVPKTEAVGSQDPAVPTGDTTPSFVRATDTKTWVEQPPATGQAGDVPFSRLGHYEIVGRIGHGGMGDVYQGYERGLDRKVAIKVLPPELARQSDFIRRFQAEATSAAKLIHPNILQIYFIGEDSGHHFFAMQYVAGESLAELLARRGRLSVDEALPIIEQALAGLAAAHKQGLIHRDIKPANILLDREHRRAVLADFGLVKSVGSSEAGHTATGVVMGTVDYISPEQGRGQLVDYRSDLYSLGVLFYQMLSGRLPFNAESPTALIFQHVYEQPPSLREAAPQVPERLVSVIAKLMRKVPADRYQSVEEILNDIRAFRAGQPLPSRADQQPWQDQGARSPRSSFIFAPAASKLDDPIVPPDVAALKSPNWWEQASGRAKSIFWRHAPEAVQRLQNTQQQVDGAVAKYARQERELRRLSEEAESVLSDLQAQVREHHSAAEQARQQNGAGRETIAVHAAQAAEIAANQMAAELERQANEQQDQLGAIKLKLAQIVTKRRELENQRDILNARLKLAGVRVTVQSGLVVKRTTMRPIVVASGAILVCIVAIYVYRVAPSSQSSAATEAELQTTTKRGPKVDRQAALAAQSVSAFAPEQLRAVPLQQLTPVGSTSGVRGVAFTTDAGQLSLFSQNSTKVFQAGTWDLQAEYNIQLSQPPICMILSPDSKIVASGSTDGRIHLSQADSGQLLRSSTAVGQSVKSLAFSHDGKILASIYLDRQDRGSLQLWNTSDMQRSRMQPDVQEDIQSVVFDAQGKWLAYGSGTGIIRIQNSSTGELDRELSPQEYSIGALAIGPDGRTLVSGDDGGNLVLWDPKSGRQIGVLSAHAKPIESLAIAPDGRHLASSDLGGTLLWDMTTGVVQSVLKTDGRTQLSFDRGTKYLATTELASGRTVVWNAEFQLKPFERQTYEIGARVEGLSELSVPPVIVNDKDLIFADGFVAHYYDAELRAMIPRFKGHSSPIRAMAISKDRATLLAAAENGSARVWNVSSGDMITTFAIAADAGTSAASTAAALSDDGKTAVIATGDGLYFAQVANGSRLVSQPLELNQVSALAWSSLGSDQILLVGGQNPKTQQAAVVAWNVTRQTVQCQMSLTATELEWISPAQDGSSIVCATAGWVHLFSTSDGHLIREWEIPVADNTAFALVPNGDGIAVAQHSDIGIWDLNLGQEVLRTKRGDTKHQVKFVMFSRGGETMMYLDDQCRLCAEARSRTLLENRNGESVLSDTLKLLHGPWSVISVSEVAQQARLSAFQLDQNPLIHLQGPATDPDLKNFSTDGGWWVNRGGLVKQPGASRAAIDLGDYGEFHFQSQMELHNGSRLFFVFGWDGQSGHCLASSGTNDCLEWTLTSFPEGTPQRLSMQPNPRGDPDEPPQVHLRSSRDQLVLALGSMDAGNPTQVSHPLTSRRGRLLMGIAASESKYSGPIKILSLSVSQY